ncbi:hypothetical protein HO133_001119 [Letharia lupina]|uniref:F-box domain-containing protein n=1 Tax=Letharia lupina TaxID=560253 RepID=A0A8H6FBS5_9LECA|nr:uncharacterized protein HO133_001119 [Letharia lupina]KAF6222034.1 hypothetical protein HO133_001119 [Letharia lupina]
MTSQLDKLPHELLIGILSCLPKIDLKQARLSCHRLRNAGDPELFRRVYFAPREKSMDAFKHIAANPAFNRNMNEVIYDGRLFQQHFLEPEMYYRAYNLHVRAQGEDGERGILADCDRAEKEIRRDMKDIKSTGSKPSEREHAALKVLRERTYHGRVLKSMKQYVQSYIQQEKILDTGRDRDVLFAGLKQMPKVYRLSIIDQFPRADHASGMDHSWYQKASTKSFACSLEPMGWPVRYRNGLRIVSDEEVRPSDGPWDCRGIVNILKAAATHNPKIDNFELGLERSNAPMKIFQMLSNDRTSIHNIARGLNDLVLNVSPPWASANTTHCSTPEEVACLKSILQQTTELFSLVANIFLTYNQWKDVFSELYFPHLITLHLGRLACWTPNGLIDLLERHKASLRELKICEADMNAEEGTWKDVAQRLGQSLNLRYIGLVSLEDALQIGRFQYSYDGYFMLAMLFMPSYSPQTHYLLEGLNVIEVVQRDYEPGP